jgi:hypothetical protein
MTRTFRAVALKAARSILPAAGVFQRTPHVYRLLSPFYPEIAMSLTDNRLLVGRITAVAYSRAARSVSLAERAGQSADYEIEETVQIWHDAVVTTHQELGHPQFLIKAVRVYAMECGGGCYEVDYVDFFLDDPRKRVIRFFSKPASQPETTDVRNDRRA